MLGLRTDLPGADHPDDVVVLALGHADQEVQTKVKETPR